MENETINDSKEYCSRCKMKEAELICNLCEPFKYFCSSCDEYVHTLPSKRKHSRTPIERRCYQNQNRELSYSTHYKTNSNVEYSYTDQFNKTKYNNPIITQNSIEYNNTNYGNEIKKIYEREKEDIINKTTALEKNFDAVKNNLNEHIITLQNQIEDNNKKFNLNLNILEEENNMKLKKICNDKDNEIRQLLNKNRELDKCNEELLSRINEYIKDIHELKEEYNDKLSGFDYEIQQRDKDINEMKLFYENRLSQLSTNFNDEKAKLIHNYDKNIDRYI